VLVSITRRSGPFTCVVVSGRATLVPSPEVTRQPPAVRLCSRTYSYHSKVSCLRTTCAALPTPFCELSYVGRNSSCVCVCVCVCVCDSKNQLTKMRFKNRLTDLLCCLCECRPVVVSLPSSFQLAFILFIFFCS
jgi:hypothetical protein